jgi:hypothetical protein
LIDAHPVFIIVENFFCLYFSGEWTFRFLSFAKKKNCFRDAWFVFDSILVFMMVFETWIMTGMVVFAGGSSGALGDTSILRLFRLMRLSRMARMARLLRAVPELMVLIKGMLVAMRSVVFTFLLLGGFLYIFGIAFVQLMKDTPAGEQYFQDVPMAMNSLLLFGVLPDEAEIIENVGADGWFFKIMIMFYIILAGLCVMNMLIGVLCEVVTVVSSVEKESMLVNYVKSTLQHMLTTSGIDMDGDAHISKREFEVLLEFPGAAKAIQEVGVDVVGLMDFTDFIFQDGKELSFPDFMDMVLQLRGTNTATVKDLVDLRKVLISELGSLDKKFADLSTRVGQEAMQALTAHGGGFPGMGPGGGACLQQGFMMVPAQMPAAGLDLQPIATKNLSSKSMSWAANAASRLASAASELSAAAGELQSRQTNKKIGNADYLKIEDAK